MNKLARQASVLLMVAMSALGGCTQEAPQKTDSTPAPPPQQNLQTGEALFKQYCSPCHPDGGNISNLKRTLHGSDLKANQITKPEDIVRIMRNPISRMIRFDTTTIPDQEARAIAAYVLTTFR